MSTIIRLLDANGTVVQDSISADYEDSFCLETFEDLCDSHFDAEPKNTKGFIIARVQTLDPKQPDKVMLFDPDVLFILQRVSPEQNSIPDPNLPKKAIYSSLTRPQSSYQF